MEFKVGDKVKTPKDGEGIVENKRFVTAFSINEYVYTVRLRKEKKSTTNDYYASGLALIESAQTEVGLKYDSNKPDLTLVTRELVEAVASVMDFGKAKYGRDNYKNFSKADIVRFEAALLRHMFAHLSGEINDPDSSLPHLWHVGSTLNIILWLQANK